MSYDHAAFVRSASRIASPRATHSALSCALLALIAVFLNVPSATAQVPSAWDTATSQTLVYDIVADMEPTPTSYNIHDARTLTVTIGNGQVSFVLTSALRMSTESFGPYTFSSDGRITRTSPSEPPPPLEAEWVLHVLPAAVPCAPRTAWSVDDPLASELTTDKIELQERRQFDATGQHTTNGHLLLDFSFVGLDRLVDNAKLQTLLPTPERDPHLERTINALSQFNLFAFGTFSWQVDRRAVSAFQVTYIVAPTPGRTPEYIAASLIRNRITATLRS